MTRKALIVQGGWDGHHPKQMADYFQKLLESESFSVQMSDSLDAFNDPAALASLSLIVPIWTMGDITDQQLKSVCSAVRGGVAMAGCHGGMCDAFKSAVEWHFMTGGQWVAHPGDSNVTYTVNIADQRHPITEGLKDFQVRSEQYYMHIDPAIKVLATTHFPVADGPHVGNGPVEMPVVWTKLYGKGRIFYCSIGHHPADMEIPSVREIMRRGCLWACDAG